METKKTAGAGVVTEADAQAVLRRAPARDLSPEEERVLRMRLGASPPRVASLESVGRGRTDLEIELLACEIEAHLRFREHSLARAAVAAPGPSPSPSRTKEKIVRALRKKQ